jgi:hypothetical protein
MVQASAQLHSLVVRSTQAYLSSLAGGTCALPPPCSAVEFRRHPPRAVGDCDGGYVLCECVYFGV